MPLPNPTNAWKLVKYGLRAAEYAVPAGVAWLSDLLDDEATASDIAWVRVVMEYTRRRLPGVLHDDAHPRNVTRGCLVIEKVAQPRDTGGHCVLGGPQSVLDKLPRVGWIRQWHCCSSLLGGPGLTGDLGGSRSVPVREDGRPNG